MGGPEGDRQVLQRADDPGTDELRGAVLHWQQASVGQAVRCGITGPLADRELLALAKGCLLWRGCQPDSRSAGWGELCLVTPHGPGVVKAASEPGEHPIQAVRGDA